MLGDRSVGLSGGTVEGDMTMTSWVLVIFFAATGNNGVAITTIEGLTRDSCEKTAREISKPVASVRGGKTVSAFCINKMN